MVKETNFFTQRMEESSGMDFSKTAIEANSGFDFSNLIPASYNCYVNNINGYIPTRAISLGTPFVFYVS